MANKMKIDFDRIVKALKDYKKHVKACIKITYEKHGDWPAEYILRLKGKLRAVKEIKRMLKRIIKKNGGD
jgi:hypothetical protein